jgi:hypothetical protein
MIAAVLVSCKKNTTETPAPAQTGEIEFNINTILNDFADREWNVPICNDDLVPTEAEIWIQWQNQSGHGEGDYEVYTVDVYYIGDQLYTKALTFPFYKQTDPEWFDGINCYRIMNFVVYGEDDAGAVDIYKAAPAPHSDFYEFIENGLPIEFCIIPFEKQKIDIDVLCFIPDVYELFGFFWFEITEITVREMCFFGDFCLKSTDDYLGSLYAQSGGGLFIDEPAIFQIFGYHNGVPMQLDDDGETEIPYTNEGWLGVGEPLCIKYADYDNETDYYVFDLWVYVKVGSGFEYVKLWTWTWQDDFEGTYYVGEDGVAEFVIGNCLYENPLMDPVDFLLAPYMNLPETVTMTLTGNGWSGENPPGTYNGAPYWNATFTNFGSGYDILANHEYDAHCGDATMNINAGTYSSVYVFSSLEPASNIPSFISDNWDANSTMSDDKMKALTYLANHCGGINLLGPLTESEGIVVQTAIWTVGNAILSGNPLAPLTPYTPANNYPVKYGTEYALAASLAADALEPDNFNNYMVPPGGNAFVLFYAANNGRTIAYDRQLILITVDP